MQKASERTPPVHYRGSNKLTACNKAGYPVDLHEADSSKVTCLKCLKLIQQFPEKIAAFDALNVKKSKVEEPKEEPTEKKSLGQKIKEKVTGSHE